MTFFFLSNIIILLLLSFLFSNISILVTGLLGLIVVILVARNENNQIYKNLTVIFCISIALMLVLYYGYIAKYGTPYYLGGSDDLSFEETSSYILNCGYLMPNELMQESQFYYHSAKGFLWLLSWFMRFCNIFGGYHTIAYRVINIYFLIILGLLVFKYFSKHYSFSIKQNLVVLYIMTLFPNAQYISIHVFRDTLNILILFVIFYIWDKYSKKEKTSNRMLVITLFTTIILTYISFWIRSQNLILILVIILLNLFLKDKSLTVRSFWIFLFALLAMMISFKYLNVFKEITKFNEYYTDYLLATNGGLSQKIFSMELIPFGIFFRAAFGLVSPLPVGILQFSGMFYDIDIFFKVIISIGVIIQIYLLPYLVLNIKRIDKITFLFLIFFLATVVTTFTFRHFIMLYPFMWILIFRQFFKTSKRTKVLIFINMTIVLTMSASIYLLVK